MTAIAKLGHPDLRGIGRRLGPALAVLVLLGVVVLTVFPTRAYLDQRRALDVADERLRLLSAETARLEQRVAELQTDAEIERLAREQYNLVRPGEEAYAILPPPPPAVDVRALASTLDAAVFWD